MPPPLILEKTSATRQSEFAGVAGAVLVASLTSACLYGFTLLLVLQYFKSHAKRDPWHLKLTVGILCILATLVTVFLSFQVYDMFITQHADITLPNEIKLTDSLVNKLILYAINRAVATSICAMISTALYYNGSSGSYYFLIPVLAITYLYVISAVSVLTSREGLRKEAERTIELSDLSDTTFRPDTVLISGEADKHELTVGAPGTASQATGSGTSSEIDPNSAP
ncbi:hypothetical protein D9613_004651 [Agrocybe pediades]|uniref:DUF6534 domain-containing protein n=1 Tax=Agrocybe pediades TaxID=84607 RepID=A0A8H4VR91_9AGAR|nr:hypothetical protein D9613_004651 [Agrocybe pediades]